MQMLLMKAARETQNYLDVATLIGIKIKDSCYLLCPRFCDCIRFSRNVECEKCGQQPSFLVQKCRYMSAASLAFLEPIFPKRMTKATQIAMTTSRNYAQVDCSIASKLEAMGVVGSAIALHNFAPIGIPVVQSGPQSE